MTIQADDVQTLHDYAQGVMTRVAHHAGNVGAVGLAILGGIIWRAKPGSIKIKEHVGTTKNVVWWTSAQTGNKYVCRYEHSSQEIEIRDRTVRGNIVHRLTNSTPITTVEQIFSGL